jgi:hypothetical protein
MVPVAAVPPVTAPGLKLRPAIPAGLTVRTADRVTPPAVAEIVTGVWTVTGATVIVRYLYLPPGLIVTVAGTTATEGFELDSETGIPAVPAAPEIYT